LSYTDELDGTLNQSRRDFSTASDLQFMNELLTACIPQLRRTAQRMLRNREDSEDVLQDALLSACKNIRQFQSRAKFTTWMHTILCNSIRTMWRRRRVRPLTSPFASDIADQNLILAEDIPDHGLSPEEEFRRSEAAGTVAELLARLPPIYRDAVLLCKIKELNVADAAQRLGIREGTVKARIHRARAMIQKFATPQAGW
jgi:RNA polymerase sigma-70 factor, ECF subfamily